MSQTKGPAEVALGKGPGNDLAGRPISPDSPNGKPLQALSPARQAAEQAWARIKRSFKVMRKRRPRP